MSRIRSLFLNNSFILWLIIINSIIIFIQGFELDSDVKFVLSQFDNIFTLLFVIELIVKVTTLGFSSYLKSGWNIFDGILILLAFPSLFVWFFYGGTGNLEYLLVLRIARVFKFFRFLRFIPDVEQLVNGVQRALKASVIVILGFFVFSFVISVLSCFLYRSIAPEYFSNPVVSFYTVFRIFTVEGWYEIPDYIAKNASQTVAALSKMYFVIILMSGGIFGLSLVNSIFVDAMVSDNNDELERKVELLNKKIDTLLKNK